MSPERWSVVNRILNQALELNDAAARQAYLDRECRGDSELRSEVDSLIAVAGQSAFLDQPAVVSQVETAAMPAQESEPHAPLQIGQQFGPYRIVSKLGEGGMGVVYQAIDTRLDRRVALKLLLADDQSTTHKTRFAREARAASALNHPNIATIYEFDHLQGADFIAMEYVEGASLHDILWRRATPQQTLLGYARQVASAVGAAHKAGIVHRDLKPSNIMVTRDGVVKVLDFGLAKLASQATSDADATKTMALTRAGAIIGTPSYMSPEQVAGEAVDYRTDIFAFGIILYEMACGERPFRGPNPHSTLHLIATAEPKSVTRLNAAVPPGLVTLIDQCLKKKKEERLQSMSDAVAKLSALAEKPKPPQSRRPIGLIVLAGALVLAGGAYWFSRPAPPKPPAAATVIERSIIGFIQAQRMMNGRPVGEPYLASPRDTFESDWRFRLLAESPQPGYLYLVSEGADAKGANQLYVLYPEAGKPDVPLRAHQKAEMKWVYFDSHPGTDRLWLVWAEQPVPDLQRQGDGRVEDATRARRMLSTFQSQPPGTTGGVEVRGTSKLLGTLVELRHR